MPPGGWGTCPLGPKLWGTSPRNRDFLGKFSEYIPILKIFETKLTKSEAKSEFGDKLLRRTWIRSPYSKLRGDLPVEPYIILANARHITYFGVECEDTCLAGDFVFFEGGKTYVFPILSTIGHQLEARPSFPTRLTDRDGGLLTVAAQRTAGWSPPHDPRHGSGVVRPLTPLPRRYIAVAAPSTARSHRVRGSTGSVRGVTVGSPAATDQNDGDGPLSVISGYH